MWTVAIAGELAHRAARVIASPSSRWGNGAFGERVRAALGPVVGPDVLDRWLACLDDVSRGSEDPPPEPVALDALTTTRVRKHDGIFFTPTALADGMAALMGDVSGGWVVDPSAGDGELLRAAIRAQPDARAWGVELHEPLAVGAAIGLWGERARQGRWPDAPLEDRVVVGDGLALENHPDDGVACVLGNPPYMGEKGRADRFAQVRARHPDLAERMTARGDLLYLFMHRAMDLLGEGGRMVFVTSEYWLSATGARALRDDLTTRGQVELIYGVEGAGVFADAPGHHTLIVRVERGRGGAGRARSARAPSPPLDWAEALTHALEEGRPVDLPGDGAPWAPWASARDGVWRARFEASGARLGELARDRQGFVSGADRLSARRRAALAAASDEEPPEVGAPIFMGARGALPDALRDLGLVRPVVRGREVEAGRVRRVTGDLEEEVLYVDGEIEGEGLAAVEAWLGPFRPVLEARREVGLGRMPWYRLHWPRSGAEQRGPKLVAPRRAPSPCFMLDLSGAAVSSDCTYLVAPDWVEDPERHLARLMLLINSAPVAWYLGAFGKRKGALVELYSEPLRGVTLPLRREGAGVAPTGWLEVGERWASLERSVEALLAGEESPNGASAAWGAAPSAAEALGAGGEIG